MFLRVPLRARSDHCPFKYRHSSQRPLNHPSASLPPPVILELKGFDPTFQLVLPKKRLGSNKRHRIVGGQNSTNLSAPYPFSATGSTTSPTNGYHEWTSFFGSDLLSRGLVCTHFKTGTPLDLSGLLHLGDSNQKHRERNC